MSVLVDNPIIEDELSKRFLNYTRDKSWIRDNYKALAKKHHDKYIAVRNEKIHYIGDNIKTVAKAIIDDGNDVSDYAIEYLTKDEMVYLL